MNPKFLRKLLLATSVTLATTYPNLSVLAQGTAFTYQGRLTDSGTAYTGTAEFQPTLWTAPSGGGVVASNSPTTVIVNVTNGLFVLPLDFGSSFPGTARWLQLEVRTAIGPFSTLNPRQPITPTPYAITAGNVLAGAGLAGVYTNAVTLNNSSNTFVGSGAGLTGLNATQLNGSVALGALSNAWKVTGNAGTVPGTHFVGTIDSQPLELRVNSQRVVRMEPDTNFDYSPNIIAGYKSNNISSTLGGQTIAGGGGTNWFGPTAPHTIAASFGTIGGGVGNVVYGSVGTIAGGERGTIGTNGYNSFIGSGAYNVIEAGDGTIAGGRNNQIAPSAFGSMIPGGYNNKVGTNAYYSFAGGQQAVANHSGTFVWSDNAGGTFTSTGVNQFLVRAAGGVGIGTASPGAQLEVRTAAVSGNAIRFGYNSAGGSGNLIAGLSRVAIATDDQVERLSIRQTGNVGIGLTGPNYLLHLVADSAGKPNGGSWANSSDARIKQNIQPMTKALERLKQLRGVTFEWRNPEDHANQEGPQAGFVAQEVEKVFPKWVSEIPGAEHDRALTPDGKIKSLTLPFEFDAVVVEAIKEQQSQIEARDKDIAALKERVGALEKLMLELRPRTE
jgi:hypothetical protein